MSPMVNEPISLEVKTPFFWLELTIGRIHKLFEDYVVDCAEEPLDAKTKFWEVKILFDEI